MFETRTHNFGTVARGGKIEFAFKLKNSYEEDVHIVSVRSSCGCTSPRITKDTLKTFEEGEIVAAFNTHTFLGQKAATVTVTFDKPFAAQVQLRVSGYIRSDVVLSPASVNFGDVEMGRSADKVISVKYAGTGSWSIQEVKSPNPNLEVTFIESSRQGNRVGYDLKVHLKEGVEPGAIKDQLVLITNQGRSRTIPVTVEGRVTSPIMVTPRSVFLGTLHPGEKVSKRVVVRAKKPFKIVAIDCDHGSDSFKFQLSDKAGSRHVVPVSFTADDKTGKATYLLTVKTDLGEKFVAEFKATAHISPIRTAGK